MRKLLVRLAAVIAMMMPMLAYGSAAQAQSIPVILWHVISDTPQGRYQLSTAKFKEEIQYLKDNGFTPLAIDDYYKIMTHQLTAPAKPILLTFDDSTEDFSTIVVPVLQQNGFKATQFVVSGWVDTAGHLTSAQVTSLGASYDIQNHTRTHDDLSTMTYADAYAEVNDCSNFIQPLTGKRPQYLAYPMGRNDANAQQAARDAGILMAFTVAPGKTTPTDNFLALNRNLIPSSETLSTFAKTVN